MQQEITNEQALFKPTSNLCEFVKHQNQFKRKGEKKKIGDNGSSFLSYQAQQQQAPTLHWTWRHTFSHSFCLPTLLQCFTCPNHHPACLTLCVCVFSFYHPSPPSSFVLVLDPCHLAGFYFCYRFYLSHPSHTTMESFHPHPPTTKLRIIYLPWNSSSCIKITTILFFIHPPHTHNCMKFTDKSISK